MTAPPPEVTAAVPRETLERLERYHDLLLRWTRRINLIAPSTQEAIWSRHILDSLQLWEHVPGVAGAWADLGSGGGLPGLVVAIVAKEQRPELAVTLIESDRRKAAFLTHCIGELGLPARVLAQRVENAALPPQDVVSARALAPLKQLIALSQPLRHARTVLLFPKGRTAVSELTEARRNWHIDCEIVPSRVEGEGAILKIFGVEPRE